MADGALDPHIMDFLYKRLAGLAHMKHDDVPHAMATLVREITRTIDAAERMRAMPFWGQLEAPLRTPVVFWTEHLYHALLTLPIADIAILYASESIDETMHVRRVAYLYALRALSP